MSLTDLQAGLMLGFTGGFAFGGVFAFAVYALSVRLHSRRLESDRESAGR